MTAEKLKKKSRRKTMTVMCNKGLIYEIPHGAERVNDKDSALQLTPALLLYSHLAAVHVQGLSVQLREKQGSPSTGGFRKSCGGTFEFLHWQSSAPSDQLKAQAIPLWLLLLLRLLLRISTADSSSSKLPPWSQGIFTSSLPTAGLSEAVWSEWSKWIPASPLCPCLSLLLPLFIFALTTALYSSHLINYSVSVSHPQMNQAMSWGHVQLTLILRTMVGENITHTVIETTHLAACAETSSVWATEHVIKPYAWLPDAVHTVHSDCGANSSSIVCIQNIREKRKNIDGHIE